MHPWLRRYAITAVILTALSLNFVAAVSAADAVEGVPELRPFEPFVGHTWKALVNAERELYDVARWDRAIGGQAVRITHSVDDGAYGGETLIVWDRNRQALVYYYFTTAGFYTQGTMSFDRPDRLVSREMVVGNEDGVTEVEATQEIQPDGSLLVTTRMLRDGRWEERGQVTYRSDPTATVILPDTLVERP